MAQGTCNDSSQDSFNKRLSDIENLLTQLVQSRNNSFDTSSPNRNTGKRSLSADRDEGSKKRRSDGENFECTLCDKKYQVEWALIRHYKTYHKEKSPGRLHKENVAKRDPMKANPNQPEHDDQSPARLHEVNLAKNSFMRTTNANEAEEYICKLCENTFSSISARNSHYTTNHQIKDEKLLFFPDGSALVESPLEIEIKKNSEYFKTVLKRNTPSRVCKLCEIELDPADLISHYERDHKVIQITKVKILIRLSKTDIEQLCPIKKCNYCSDIFPDTEALENHVSTEHNSNFNVCQICEKRIERKLYNKHVMNDHPEVFFKKPSTDKIDAKLNQATEKPEVSKTVDASPVNCTPLMYMCGACNLVTSSYDNVIAHSQDHILKNVTVKPKLCEACNLEFDIDFPIHEQMHLIDPDLDRDSFRFVLYDYCNLTNAKWFDMFNAFTKAKVNKITSASIYFSTRCIRLKLLKDCRDASAPFTLFKCLKCEKYVHPKCIESHIGQRSTCAKESSGHTCVKCKKIFHTSEAMDEHKETHNVPESDSKYRTVLFNDPVDFDFNKILLENAGKSIQVEEVSDNNDPKTQTPTQVPIARSETKKANIEGVGDEGNKVASKMTNNVKDERVIDIYKCACGLCFKNLEFLLEHMRKCSNNSTKILKISCMTCKLDFDRENFNYHCKAHENGITTFNVKKLILVDEAKIIVSDNM